jgi:t-SNARE complex subunit (syntaxin)
MEQMMVNITTLISQFANLVSEQQDDVYTIHDAAAEVQQNMSQGQEHLVEAKDRTRSSHHYMAKGILAMTILLLLLHWWRP